MGWIIGFAILWFVLRGSRRRRMWRRRARMWQMHRGGPWQLHAGGPWQMHAGGYGWHRGASHGGTLARPPMHAQLLDWPHFDHVMRRPASAPPRESEFDALKRRYVAGDLSDEQYEAELDVLFSTAEGRRQV